MECLLRVLHYMSACALGLPSLHHIDAFYEYDREEESTTTNDALSADGTGPTEDTTGTYEIILFLVDVIDFPLRLS
jgi:hypothetical protein